MDLNCPHCNHELEVPSDTQDTDIECPACSKTFHIPAHEPLPVPSQVQPHAHSLKPMRKCPMCGGIILAVAKKCKHCREWIDKPTHSLSATDPSPSSLPDSASAHCPECAYPMELGARLCIRCGYRLSAEEQEEAKREVREALQAKQEEQEKAKREAREALQARQKKAELRALRKKRLIKTLFGWPLVSFAGLILMASVGIFREDPESSVGNLIAMVVIFVLLPGGIGTRLLIQAAADKKQAGLPVSLKVFFSVVALISVLVGIFSTQKEPDSNQIVPPSSLSSGDSSETVVEEPVTEFDPVEAIRPGVISSLASACRDRSVTTVELDELSYRELKLLRNYFFAYYNRPFAVQWIREYFENNMSSYSGNGSSDPSLTSIERENINRIIQYEQDNNIPVMNY